MFKEKVCKTCGNSFIPKAPAALYCCGQPSLSKDRQLKYRQDYCRRMGREVGVGKGNSSKHKGVNHPAYKNGWTSYKLVGRALKNELGECQRCGKDLRDATRWEWVCHHKDHDRTNSTRDNLEILCKRCHQLEHECWKAFEGATTIPQGSTVK